MKKNLERSASIRQKHIWKKDILENITCYPKFRAAVEFLEKREGRSALITSFDKLDEALKGKTGTLIR